MCGRYTLTNVGQIPLILETAGSEIESRYNIAPSQVAPVLIAGLDGPELRMMRWGFRQPGAPASVPAPINARAETLIERSLFRGALAQQRCLVLADGFYEWRRQPGTPARQPYYFKLLDSAVFTFAGLYTAPTSHDIGSFTIITTSPNALVAPIHNRMPAILSPEEGPVWLDRALTDSAGLLSLLDAFPEELMHTHPVAPHVSNVRNEGPALIRPFVPVRALQLGETDEPL